MFLLTFVNVREPTSFACLRTINGEICATYREVCQRLKLLDDDNHWDHTLADAVISFIFIKFDYFLLSLFQTVFTLFVVENIFHRLRLATENPDIAICAEIHNEVLI